MKKVKDFLKKNKMGVIVTTLSVVVIVLLIIVLVVVFGKDKNNDSDDLDTTTETTEDFNIDDYKDTQIPDSLLAEMQPDLNDNFGDLPDGFIWDIDGTALSIGEKGKSAEDVLYAYFKGLSTLNMETVQKYSRDSIVVDVYNAYYNESNKNTDYMDSFLRNMYTQCLLSLQLDNVESSAVFAENKMVFTINAKILDLTDKEFWKSDRDVIYKNLYTYSLESDSAKSDQYLYDYILDYYKSNDAQLRDVSFDITLQKYPDLNSGWLVSVDSDVNDACSYKDGKLVVSYIKDQYRSEGIEFMQKQEIEEAEKEGN